MNTSNRYDVETLARQHQKEIADELSAIHLLNQSNKNSARAAWPQQRILRLAPMVILMTLLLLYFFH